LVSHLELEQRSDLLQCRVIGLFGTSVYHVRGGGGDGGDTRAGRTTTTGGDRRRRRLRRRGSIVGALRGDSKGIPVRHGRASPTGRRRDGL
jgi:hypothetical protein